MFFLEYDSASAIKDAGKELKEGAKRVKDLFKSSKSSAKHDDDHSPGPETFREEAGDIKVNDYDSPSSKVKKKSLHEKSELLQKQDQNINQM